MIKQTVPRSTLHGGVFEAEHCNDTYRPYIWCQTTAIDNDTRIVCAYFSFAFIRAQVKSCRN